MSQKYLCDSEEFAQVVYYADRVNDLAGVTRG